MTSQQTLGNIHLIYHGADPAISTQIAKREARTKFGLPQEGQLALVLGFRTPAKGWDMLEKMKVPDGWSIVISSSENHYIKCDMPIPFDRVKNIYSLSTDFLTEPDLSCLFYASDALILPYRVSSGSGAIFDGLARITFCGNRLGIFQGILCPGIRNNGKEESTCP